MSRGFGPMSIVRLTAVAAALLCVSAPARAESPHRYAVEVSVVSGKRLSGKLSPAGGVMPFCSLTTLLRM